MKRILILFILLATSIFGQSFPVKVNSTGAVTEPSTWLGQNLGLSGFPQFIGLNLNGNTGTQTKLNFNYNTFGWDVALDGTGSGNPGGFQIDDQNSGNIALKFLVTTDQPQFSFLNTAGLVVTDSTGKLSVVADGAINTFYGINGSGVRGFYTSSGTISGLTTNAFVYANGSTSIASTIAATNGQILIGSTGAAPVKAAITQGSANQVVVTNGAGSITLSLPQDIATSSTPSFSRVTSTVATGTSPFVVASTTNVANLNASSLNGATFAAPGAIGGTTAATSMALSGNITQTIGTATALDIFQTNSTNSSELEMSNDGRVRMGNTGTSGTPDLVIGHLGASGGGTIIFATNNTQRAQLTATTLIASTSITSSSAIAGVGYSTGAGGTVTQTTSRTTGVTLNTVSGAITMVSAAGLATYQTFTVTDSAVAATDTISINQKSGSDIYIITVHAVAAGSFQVSYATTGGTTTEQPVFQFNVIKGSNS